MIQSQLPAAIRENPFRISRLNHSSDFRADWDVDSLNSAQSDWIINEIHRLSGRRTPDAGQLIPIVLSQPGYGKTHIFGRLANQLGGEAFFVFVGAVPDPKRILDHLRWTVVETLFLSADGNPAPLDRALAHLLHPSLIEYAAQFALDDPKHGILKSALQSPIDGTLQILRASHTLSSFQKLATSMSARMPHVRAAVLRAMVMALSPARHLARQWLRGEKLSDDEGRKIGILDDSPTALDVLNAVAAILEYKKPMVICFDQIESILKEPQGAKQLGINLMELLAGVPNQYLIVSCFVQAWFADIRQFLPPALIRRTKELELNYPAPEHALALVKKRLNTWPGYDVKRGEYFPFDSARIERFAREEKPMPAKLIQLCEVAMDGWMNGKLKAPLIVTLGDQAEESLAQLFRKRWNDELATAGRDPQRQPEEMSDARIFAAMKEIVGLIKSAGDRWPGLQVNLIKEPVLPNATAYPRYGMRIEFVEAPGKYSVTAGVTTMNGGNALFYYIREFVKTLRSSRGGVLLYPRHDFALGKVGSGLVKRAKDAGKLEILSLKEHRDMFVAMECACSLFEQAQAGMLVLGTTAIAHGQCQELMRESGVLDDIAFVKNLGKWSSPTPVRAVINHLPADDFESLDESEAELATS